VSAKMSKVGETIYEWSDLYKRKHIQIAYRCHDSEVIISACGGVDEAIEKF
jgi:hypothetical protein